MRFIEISDSVTVNPNFMAYVSSDKNGFGVVHIGIERFVTRFSKQALVNILRIESTEMGVGPDPTATALAY